jgi:hypothetical protein
MSIARNYNKALFEKIRDMYPTSNISYVPTSNYPFYNLNLDGSEKHKTGPKVREINRDTIINGTCITETCRQPFNKIFRKLNNEFSGPYCIDCIRKKGNVRREKTCKQKYGVITVAHVPEVKDKKNIKLTNYINKKQIIKMISKLLSDEVI